MRPGAAKQRAVSTRDRILEAALRWFSRHSYEATGLRDIAADVGVDVAYVHRCFGSKQRLFVAALRASLQPDRIFSDGAGNLADTLAKQLFARDSSGVADKIWPLDIVIRSLTSPEAMRVLRKFILQDFVSPLAEKLDKPMQSRAALIAAFLAGVGIFRNVLRIEPLLDAKGGELEKLIVNAIAGMMSAGSPVEGA